MFAQRPHETTLLFLLRWMTRISGAVSIGLILLFVFGENWQFSQLRWEELGTILFPLGLVSGLILGWLEEIRGGALAIGSVAAFYVVYGLAFSGSIRQGWGFALFAIPGVLFLIHGLLSRRATAGPEFSNSRDLTNTTR